MQAKTCSCIATEFFKSSITKDSKVQLRATDRQTGTKRRTDYKSDSDSLCKLLTKPRLSRTHHTGNVIE